jgi:hypothetical protein
MGTYHAEASAVITAPPEVVYRIIADYGEMHPRILPRPPFTYLEVEQGGVGAGTEVRFGMTVMGREQVFRADIAEPEPGRVLVETTRPDGPATIFTVEPLDGGAQSRVTIATEGKVRDGLAGRLERFTTERFLKQVYEKELGLLARLAETG